MPPTEESRSVGPANVIPSAGTVSGGEHAWVQDDAATEDPPVTDPRLLRAATSPGAAPSRNSHLRRFDDPCNYLG